MRARIAAACLAALVGLGVSGRDVLAQESKPDADKFAQIAARQADYSGRDLVSITPAPLARRLLPLDAAPVAAAFQPAAKMATAEQLCEELQRQRQLHAPYLQDLAPPLDDLRIRVPVESFDWRVETDDDRRDFAGTLAGEGKWELVARSMTATFSRCASTCVNTTVALTANRCCFTHAVFRRRQPNHNAA